MNHFIGDLGVLSILLMTGNQFSKVNGNADHVWVADKATVIMPLNLRPPYSYLNRGILKIRFKRLLKIYHVLATVQGVTSSHPGNNCPVKDMWFATFHNCDSGPMTLSLVFFLLYMAIIQDHSFFFFTVENK